MIARRRDTLFRQSDCPGKLPILLISLFVCMAYSQSPKEMQPEESPMSGDDPACRPIFQPQRRGAPSNPNLAGTLRFKIENLRGASHQMVLSDQRLEKIGVAG
jgi:hypothetical protein